MAGITRMIDHSQNLAAGAGHACLEPNFWPRPVAKLSPKPVPATANERQDLPDSEAWNVQNPWPSV